MGRYGGMNRTKTAGSKSAWFLPGLHLCRVDRVKAFTDGMDIDRTAVEFTILKTIVPGDDDEKHKPGQEVSKLWEDRGIWIKSQLKQFLAAAGGLTREEAEEEDMEAVAEMAIDEATQPLSGTIMLVKGVPKPTKAGGLITAVEFKESVQPHEALEKMGGDIDALRTAYNERTGFKSLADFNARAAESAKEAGVEWKTIE